MQVPQIGLGELQVSGKGQKSIKVTTPDSKGDVSLLPGKMAVPFNPSAYQNAEASRLNLCFTPTAVACMEGFKQLEEQLVELLRPQVKDLLGLDSDGSADWFRSAVKSSKHGTPFLRTEINMDGRNAPCVWGSNKQLTLPPVDWSTFTGTPKIWVKQLYVSNKEIGLVLECTDIPVESIRYGFPFQ